MGESSVERGGAGLPAGGPQATARALAGLGDARAIVLVELPDRPLHALVSTDNVGSIRVLEKCGFVEIGPADDRHADEGVPGLLYELRDAPSPGD